MGQKIFSVRDFQSAAKRRLPRIVFDFLEGGALDEITLRENRSDFDILHVVQRVLCDVRQVELGTNLLGRPLAMPIVVSPMGGLALYHPEGDLAIARAAHKAGTVFIHSAWSSSPLEQVVAIAPHSTWVQVAFWQDKGFTAEHVARARAAGADVLVVAGDVGVSSKRERDLRNGAGIPPSLGIRGLASMATKPRWLARYAVGRKLTYGNYEIDGRPMQMAEMESFMHAQENPGATWSDVEELRNHWSGKIIVKGIMAQDDVHIAKDVGVDAVMVSNHGGRQFDAQLSTVAALPRLVDEAGGAIDVIVDGGIRRGSDVVKCLALGATACGIGRPAAYALATRGTDGPDQLFGILAEELRVALGFAGCTDVRRVDRSLLEFERAPAAAFNDWYACNTHVSSRSSRNSVEESLPNRTA